MSSEEDGRRRREHYLNVNRIALLNEAGIEATAVLDGMKDDEIFTRAHDELYQEIRAQKTNIAQLRLLLDKLVYFGKKAHRSFWRAVCKQKPDFMDSYAKEKVRK